MHWRWKWQPTPVFLPGESQGQGSLVGCRLWGRTESDTTEVTQQQQQQYKRLLSLLQHHSSKASILRHSAFFRVQLSHPYLTTGKSMALTRWTFVGKVMSLLFNKLSRLVIAFLPRSNCLLISWLQSPSAVILEPQKIKSLFPLFPHLSDMK